MITVDRKGDGLWNEAGTGERCPDEEFPILEAFFSQDAENDYGPEKRGQVVQPKPKGVRSFLWGIVFSQECPDPFIKIFGRIDGLEELFVAVDQRIIAHCGDKIGREISIVPRSLFQKPLFFFEPLIKLRARKGYEDADHGGDNTALLDELDLGVEDREGVIVKTDDESSLYFQTGPLDAPDTGEEIAVLVLDFAALRA